MDAQKVDTFIMTNGKYFPSEFILPLREMLLNADESKWSLIQTIQYKDPTYRPFLYWRYGFGYS